MSYLEVRALLLEPWLAEHSNDCLMVGVEYDSMQDYWDADINIPGL